MNTCTLNKLIAPYPKLEFPLVAFGNSTIVYVCRAGFHIVLADSAGELIRRRQEIQFGKAGGVDGEREKEEKSD